MNYKKCDICPRACGIDRTNAYGYCGCGSDVRIARASRHMWEEPCISGTNGSGTVFFSGCNMKCVFCQNEAISRGVIGTSVTTEQLKELFLIINESGVHNINLVTPSHYLVSILEALKDIKHRLSIPVVYNCSGYESTEAIKACKGIIDIFLTDIKYRSNELSKKYSNCNDYFDVASKALGEMIKAVGTPIITNDIMTSGVIVRHLILPSHKNDSIEILNSLAKEFGNEAFLVSLMNQYTPMPLCQQYPEIDRRVTSLEYSRVVKVFEELDFKGYVQERSSAKDIYIPDFKEHGEFLDTLIDNYNINSY